MRWRDRHEELHLILLSLGSTAILVCWILAATAIAYLVSSSDAVQTVVALSLGLGLPILAAIAWAIREDAKRSR